MDGDFSNQQPKFEDPKYVMIDWDETLSLNTDMVKVLFNVFQQFGFIVKVFTARYENKDNSDIFIHVNKEDVFFADGKQKKDALLFKYQIPERRVAFWIDDNPAAIVDKEDLHGLLSYLNS